MRAHQIMIRQAIVIAADAPIQEAANIMLKRHISGLPVVDGAGKLLGIVSATSFAAPRSGRSENAAGG